MTHTPTPRDSADMRAVSPSTTRRAIDEIAVTLGVDVSDAAFFAALASVRAAEPPSADELPACPSSQRVTLPRIPVAAPVSP